MSEGQKKCGYCSSLSFYWKSPYWVMCQMALLYLCQWHTFWGLWCVSISPLYSASIQCDITAGYLKKMLVTSEGCPDLGYYNCPSRAFQTLPRSPLSSMLQLLTSHPGKINSVTMHRMETQSTHWHWQTHSNFEMMRSQMISSNDEKLKNGQLTNMSLFGTAEVTSELWVA